MSKLKNNLFWSSVIVIIFPFIYFYKLVLPGKSFSLTIGNDFVYLYYNSKVYLLDKLSNFSIPLWSPSEAGGFPFYSDPFCQVFYPLNAVLVFFYKINNGYSVSDHQIFTISGLSIFAFGLLIWLRSLKVNLLYAVIAVCIVTVSAKLTEVMRFPNAVHTIAWVPFILYGCTLALDFTKRFKSALVIILSVVLMITAGYPYFVFYSAFLIFPYILLMSYILHKKFMNRENDNSVIRYLTVITLSFAAAFAVCYPYLNKIRHLMDQMPFREGNNFGFSTFQSFSFTDTVGSLVYPPASFIEGWYYFGLPALFIVICLYLFYAFNLSENKNYFSLLFIIAVWFVLISYITYGKNSYLFELLWNYFPGFSRIRIVGRMNILFLPVFAYLLSSSMNLFFNVLPERRLTDNKFIPKYKYSVITFMLIYACIIFTQFYFFNNKIYKAGEISFSKGAFQDFDEKTFIYTGVISFLIVVSVLFYGMKARLNKSAGAILLLIFFAVNIYDLYYADSNQWFNKTKTPVERKILEIDKANLSSFSVPRNYNTPFLSLTSVFSAGVADEWFFDRYHKFFRNYAEYLVNDTSDIPQPSDDEVQALNQLLGIKDGKKIYFTDSIEYRNIFSFISDSRNYEPAEIRDFKIEKYNGDELVISFYSGKKGFCSFIDNWESDWKVEINGSVSEIKKLFGTFKSVSIEKGKNTVTFKYSPGFF